MSFAQTQPPLLFYLILACVFIANIFSGSFLGLNFSGLAWFSALLISLFIIVLRSGRIAFPILIWIPWILMLLLYLLISDSAQLDVRVNPLQRTFQLVAPLFVGVAASTYRPSTETVNLIINRLRHFAYLLFIIYIFSAMLSPEDMRGLAAQVMTLLLLGLFFLNRYFMFKTKKDLLVYSSLLLIPLLSVTRMVIAVMLLSAPFSFAKVHIVKRLLWGGLIVAAILVVFQLPQVQEKMFFSGSGSLSDISLDNPDFATSGRSYMWNLMWYQANMYPWFGQGTGAGESMAYGITLVGYPHNDWLLTFFDYGWLGVGLFLISNIFMIINCMRASRKAAQPTTKFLFVAGASTFLPFMLVMYTDNIMVYASYFGILQYMLIGFAYGALKHERLSSRSIA